MGKRRRRSFSSSATSLSSSTSSSSSYSTTWDAQTLFALMLAALSNRESEVIQKALHHLLLSLLSKSPNSILCTQKTLHTSLISLLPLLLNSRCSEIASNGLEIVGAASLFSIEMNEQIALDDEIVKGLITAVASSRRSVSMAACNALLDLFTTSVGRCKLLEFSAIDNLMWEGFVHVAFHLWGHNCNLSGDHSSHNLDDVVLHLMHIAVKLIGDVDPTCRKACLIGAVSFPLATDDFLETNQRSTFNHLLSIINSDSNFNDVFSTLEMAIRKNEDLFEMFRWVRHLDPKMTSMAMEDLYYLVVHQKDKVEAAFIEAKTKFCNEVVFDDVVHHYSLLLGKFRSMRKQYINGMLALSCI